MKVLVLPIPEKVYLQWYGTEDENPDPSEGAVDLADVPWHNERVFNSDVEYVLASTLTTTQEEVVRLKSWKEQQKLVESQWDVQAVGKLLGVPLGDQVRPAIQPGIENLADHNRKLRDENARLREALVLSLIPIEVLNIDRKWGASWMYDEVKDAIVKAIVAARAALKEVE